jgi:hypothetical protein
VIAPPWPQSDDPDYLAGLISRVAVEEDVNAAGDAPAAPGDAAPNYRPVPGLEAVPCRLVRHHLAIADLAEVDQRSVERPVWRVLLGIGPPLGRAHRLVDRGPDGTAPPRYLYPTGPIDDAHQMGHHWAIDAVEET